MAHLTRRTLLQAAAGAAFSTPYIAAHTAQAQQKPLVPRQSDWAGYTPGLLSQIRLGKETVTQMRQATHFAAQYGRGAAGGTIYTPSARFPPRISEGRVEFPEIAMANRLAALLLNDAIWVEKHVVGWGDFTPVYEFRIAGDSSQSQAVTAAVHPQMHTIQLTVAGGASDTRILRALLDPVAEPMNALIKEAFPDNPDAQKLTLVPKPPAPIVVRPASVSPALWASITAFKHGMARAALNQFFDGEDGMASRLWQGFYAKDLGGPKKGPYLKTIAEFAPLEAQIFWRNGRGFFRNPGEEAACANTRERSSDVITHLSPFYWSEGLAG